jgi:hypothetical protein
MSQLTSKLGSRGEVVRLYGTTPPRSGSSPDLIMSAAEKLVARVRGLPLDGFVGYDLQDESSRTAAPRPFPFIPTVDSRGYSKRLGELTGKSAVERAAKRCSGAHNRGSDVPACFAAAVSSATAQEVRCLHWQMRDGRLFDDAHRIERWTEAHGR